MKFFIPSTKYTKKEALPIYNRKNFLKIKVTFSSFVTDHHLKFYFIAVKISQ